MKKLGIRKDKCTFCGEIKESWHYKNCKSKLTGKFVRYTDHVCPKLNDVNLPSISDLFGKVGA